MGLGQDCNWGTVDFYVNILEYRGLQRDRGEACGSLVDWAKSNDKLEWRKLQYRCLRDEASEGEYLMKARLRGLANVLVVFTFRVDWGNSNEWQCEAWIKCAR